MRDGYLVDLGGREYEAVERLLELPAIGERFFSSLGLVSGFSWYVLRMRADRVVGSIHGDIDLLAGRLEWTDPTRFESMAAKHARAHPEAHPSWHYLFAAWNLAADGGIAWPPALDHLVAVEAKCAYLPADAREVSDRALRSTKQSPRKVQRVRRQVEQLLSMGFDRVVLLDIIANPPGDGRDFQAWLAGSAIASRTLDAMASVLTHRLPAESPAGHYVWSAASVAGADERWRGGGAPIERRQARANPLLEADMAVKAHRHEIETRLRAILNEMGQPVAFPVIVLDCERCGEIHSVARPCRDDRSVGAGGGGRDADR